MNKNSVIGIVLIGVIFFGFTWYQSKQYQKQVEYQAQQDSIARAEQAYMDSVWRAQHPIDSAATALQEQQSVKQRIYKDTLIDNAHNAEAAYYVLSNDKIEVTFTTKGAQPYSVKVKDFYNYDSTDLYIFKPEMSQYGITVYAGENINTKDFVFELAEKTDTSIVMRLPFAGGGYIACGNSKSYKNKGYSPEKRTSARREIAFQTRICEMEGSSTHLRCSVRIDLCALERNLGKLRSFLPDTKAFMGLVSADAFGCGVEAAVVRLMLSGADAFAVTNSDEGKCVREVGEGWPVIVMSSTLPGEERIYTAGEPEWESRGYRMKYGCPVPPSLQKVIDTLSARFGLSDSWPWH